MTRQLLVFCFCITFGLLLPSTLLSQQLSNIRFEQDLKQLIVYYDLTGVKEGQAYEVSLYYSLDGGKTLEGPAQSVSGAVGKGQTAGYGKKIIWEVMQDRENLIAENLVVEVQASLEAKDEVFTVQGISFKMVYVEGGSFIMGCTSEQSNCGSNEKPAHRVSLSSFQIGETEVTRELWWAVMGNESRFECCPQYPIGRVKWDEAQTFIKKLNRLIGQSFRLPTEAEWEFAARGGNKSQGFKYAGSNKIDEVAWYLFTHPRGQTHSVKGKSPNELGLYDMSGNVWEWCQDWYGEYSKSWFSAQKNPQGPNSGRNHVIRGGSSSDHAFSCRVSSRTSDIGTVGSRIGFRLAKSISH